MIDSTPAEFLYASFQDISFLFQQSFEMRAAYVAVLSLSIDNQSAGAQFPVILMAQAPDPSGESSSALAAPPAFDAAVTQLFPFPLAATSISSDLFLFPELVIRSQPVASFVLSLLALSFRFLSSDSFSLCVRLKKV